MKKKFLSLLLAVCTIASCATTFASCGGSSSKGESSGDTPSESITSENVSSEEGAHSHNWSTEWVINSKVHCLVCDSCDILKDYAEHTFVDDVCSVCGYSLLHDCEYGDYKSDSSEHWKVCSICCESTAKESHDGNPCSICGFYEIPVVSTVRDLGITTLRTNKNGIATLVQFPDGRNMLIDSGAVDLTAEIEVDELLLSANIAKLDYLVLTSASDSRTGAAASIVFEYYDVANFYKPEISSNITPSEAYNAAEEKAAQEEGCVVKTIDETSCDISYTFKDNSGTLYTYEIDFMIPIAAEDATCVEENSVIVSINYQDKVVLLANDATVKNVDAYCDKYGTQKDVDVLITPFIAKDQYAITASENRGSDYLTKIGLGASDYAGIMDLTGAGSSLRSLSNKLAAICGESNVYAMSSDTNLTTFIVKISSAGALTVMGR